MQVNSLSASAIQVLESCEARFKAEYIDKTPNMAGSAANLGTCVHEVLQIWVQDGHYLKDPGFITMKAIYDMTYAKYFPTMERHEEGRKMVQDWYGRQDWSGREVLSTELKTNFILKAEGLEVPFNYIWDRCDKILNQDGSFDIEIVDYKSVIQPISPDDLRTKIQARCYGLAGQIAYPDARRIWVTFDLLRYSPVGVVYSREENIATYRYLQESLKRVIHSKGEEEKLNPECRWCVRKSICDTLIRHVAGGGVLRYQELDEAVDARAEYQYAMNGLKALIDGIDEFILEQLEENNETEHKTENTIIKIASRSTRKIDSERAAKYLGADLMAKYGNLGVTALDKILKTELGLDAETKSALKQLIRKEYGNAYLKVEPLSPLDSGD